ncbi:MAG: hypothetical protein JRI25_14975 [Deltaproteobacteria bacterium]|nr:hypothetical protein [Deltaproteobacteria bacterium]
MRADPPPRDRPHPGLRDGVHPEGVEPDHRHADIPLAEELYGELGLHDVAPDRDLRVPGRAPEPGSVVEHHVLAGPAGQLDSPLVPLGTLLVHPA